MFKVLPRKVRNVGDGPTNCEAIVKEIAGTPPGPHNSGAGARSQPNITMYSGECYSINYRLASCEPTQQVIDYIANRMKPFFASATCNGRNGADILQKKWKDIVRIAKIYNWNPIFILTMWIEESAAGGCVPAWQLGCVYKYSKQWQLGDVAACKGGSWTDGFTKMSQFSTVCEQMGCMFPRCSALTNDFASFMCGWSEGEPRGCVFNGNPGFPQQIGFWYNEFTNNSTTGLHPNPACRLQFSGPGC